MKMRADCRIVASVGRSGGAVILQYYVITSMAADPPRYRPLERFWPYAELPEQPTEEELASLDPDLHEALFGGRPRPFSISLVFPPLDVPDFAAALDIARASAEFREIGAGPARRYRARFWSSDAAKLRDLFQIVGGSDATEVLIDDRRADPRYQQQPPPEYREPR